MVSLMCSYLLVNSNLTVRYNPNTDLLQIYNNGIWLDCNLRVGIGSLYLFDNGKVNPLVGSFVSHGDVSATINNALKLPYNGTPRIITSVAIDVTPYEKLYISGSLDNGWFGLSNKSASYPNFSDSDIAIHKSSKSDGILDISAISGLKYFVCQYGQTITSVWLSN